MRLWVLIAFMVLSGPCHAGPWPRGQGHWFSATTSSWGDSAWGRSYASYLYAEYGLTGTLTLVLDGSLSQGRLNGVVYTRLPIWTGPGGQRLALELGGGTDAGQPVIRPGLSFGRALETRWGAGWISVDASAKVGTASGDVTYKADTTFGVAPSERWKMYLQLQTEVAPTGQFRAKLAPAVVRRISPHLWAMVGMTHQLNGPKDRSVQLGIWVEF